MPINIPKGKKVIISTINDIRGETSTLLESLANVELVLEEDITLNFNTTYSSITNASSNASLKFISQLSRDLANYNIGTDFKELGYQMWEKTDPLSLNITIGLYMKTNARTDVFEPMK